MAELMNTLLVLVLTTLLFSSALPLIKGDDRAHAAGNEAAAAGAGRLNRVPVTVLGEHKVFFSARAAANEPFKTCAQCRCCDADGKSNCNDDARCCYEIICDQPGKPFNYCSLKPVVCGCGSCS